MEWNYIKRFDVKIKSIGDRGENFYVILIGKVEVLLPNEEI